MYPGLVLTALAVVFLIPGIAAGGAFTFVLVLMAAIAVVGAAATLPSARAAGITPAPAQQPEAPAGGPLGRGAEPPPREVPVTPEEYLEARQQSQ
ncbi:MAG TPA: hypothetical protein VG228_05870 [Solirubrobacteraceae bacterium]|jgi:hypothetical protein|nr:hypothetical protein [Solirubrobacteraceae bacterium]